MILVDTSVIVAWLDRTHPHHKECEEALYVWSRTDQLGVSSVTYAELAAGSRTRESIDDDLRDFARVDLDFASAWRAGIVFRQTRPAKGESPVLPDFFIRAQAAVHNLRHLTNDHRRIAAWPDVDFIFPAS